MALDLRFRREAGKKSFTLVEMLVAIAIFSILLILSVSIISQTRKVWVYSNSKMSQGREARVAFNSLVSRLSEATVNPYYGYTFSATGTTVPITYLPNSYVRRSELRFISGLSTNINTTVNTPVVTSPTDAVFFSAPLGVVSNSTTYGHLPSLLNVCGFYIQWTNVDPNRPSIMPASTAPYRFCLMQFIQPAESMSVYSQTVPFSTSNTNGNYPTYNFVTGTSWQNTAMANSAATGVRPIAENVVALLLLPATNSIDGSGTLAPNFLYNSEVAPPGATPATTPVNRTPPVMRVVMYTIDDASAKKLPQSSTMPNLYVDTSSNPLFLNSSVLFPNSTTGDIGDLARFEASLNSKHLIYRRFDAAIDLPSQPWNIRN